MPSQPDPGTIVSISQSNLTKGYQMVMEKIITVSIVDKEVDLLKCVADYLNVSENIRCISSYMSAEKALLHLRQDKPHVILMDISLGEIDGIQYVRRLKTVMPYAQILMLTVFDDTEQIFRALSAGANGYLLKRFSPRKLLEAIEQVYEGGSDMSAPIARKVIASFKTASAYRDATVDLSQYEYAVLAGLAEGMAYKQIAARFGMTIHTVRGCIRDVYEKLHARSGTKNVASTLQK